MPPNNYLVKPLSRHTKMTLKCHFVIFQSHKMSHGHKKKTNMIFKLYFHCWG